MEEIYFQRQPSGFLYIIGDTKNQEANKWEYFLSSTKSSFCKMGRCPNPPCTANLFPIYGHCLKRLFMWINRRLFLADAGSFIEEYTKISEFVVSFRSNV